jgi:hypothetical protein
MMATPPDPPSPSFVLAALSGFSIAPTLHAS